MSSRKSYVLAVLSLRHRFAAFGAVLGLLVLWARGVNAQSLRIQFLNVGQGDATLITSPEGRHVLIDAGPNAQAVAGWLSAEGVDTIDLAVASHAHADHIGGMSEVLRTAVVRYYLDNGWPYTSATYRRTMARLGESGAVYLEPTARGLTVGSIRLRVLPPGADARTQNEASVGILVEFGQFRALFTGDSELRELSYWLAHDSLPRVTVLKVAHHGSRNGSSADWARALQPSLAVISVGARNQYGHPSPDVVALWTSVGATVVGTAQHGTIEVAADTSGRFTLTTGLGTWAFDYSIPPRD